MWNFKKNQTTNDLVIVTKSVNEQAIAILVVILIIVPQSYKTCIRIFLRDW